MNLRDQLQAALGSAYTLDRELTGGGMSRVFVATETALGRQVVVKVLHPELAAEVTAERFAREIQMVAKLQQANIVPLLTAGHTGQLPFYTMPFVAGQSLRERLTVAGRLPIAEAIQVLRDVARALAYAHESGVVHRDIKPENILLSGGAAVVTDFGIAKAVSASRVAGSTITSVGAGIGTPSYMAPEQAAGDPATDHRADIYAFGCLAFELLSGKPPFDGPSVHEIVSAHMTRPAPELKSRREEVPTALSQLVSLCLEKQPGRRPQHATELLAALDTLITPVRASEGRYAVREPRRVAFIVGVTLVVVAVGGWLFTRGGPAAGSVSADGTAALAVIPFINVGGDSAHDYLADGLSDELATALGKVPGVQVAARSGAYRYRGARDVDVREVGSALRVRYVVQGTVRPSGERLRISAQLTDASTGVELWSNAFDRTAREVFRTQDDITAAIAGALPRAVNRAGDVPTAQRVPDSSGPGLTGLRPSAPPRGTLDVEAYNLYLRGEFALRARRIRDATEKFQEAVARDPRFARAHAGLAQAYALAPYFTSVPTDSANRVIEAAARRALELDSTLAEPYMARGMARMHSWRWREAEAEMRRAIVANPRHVESQFQLGRLYYYVGADDSAMAAWTRARAVDPFFALASGWMAQLLAAQGKIPEARAEIARAIDYDSTAAVMIQLGARVYQVTGDAARARQFASRMPQIEPWSGMAAHVLGSSGDRPGAEAIIRRIDAKRPVPWFINYALGLSYLGLRDTARTLTYLERATDAGEIWPSYNRVQDAMFDPVRKSPRWAALMQRVGLRDAPGAIR